MVKVEWLHKQISGINVNFPILRLRKKRPYLTLVQDEENISFQRVNEEQLYYELKKCNYYVTPNLKRGKHNIHFALIPFQLAIINEKELSKKFAKKLKRSGWNIVLFTEEELLTNLDEIVRRVNNVTNNFFTT